MDSNRKFRFKLAGHLGMTVKELETKMTIRELNEWFEYAKDEPLISDRLEMMLSQVISVQSGKPAFEHMVSLSDDYKAELKQQQLETDMKSQLKG